MARVVRGTLIRDGVEIRLSVEYSALGPFAEIEIDHIRNRETGEEFIPTREEMRRIERRVFDHYERHPRKPSGYLTGEQYEARIEE